MNEDLPNRSGADQLDRQTQIAELLRPTVEAMALRLWGFELVGQSSNPLLRVYIDSEAGVSIDDCERVSRQISAVLDVEDPITSAYTLEVSSPGMDRQLFEKSQYEAFVGSHIKVRLRMNYDGRRNYKGLLAAVESDEIVLRQGQEEFLFPLETIDKAQIVPEF